MSTSFQSSSSGFERLSCRSGRESCGQTFAPTSPKFSTKNLEFWTAIACFGTGSECNLAFDLKCLIIEIEFKLLCIIDVL